MTAFVVALLATALLGLLWIWDRQPRCPNCGSKGVQPLMKILGRQFMQCVRCLDYWEQGR